MVITGAECVPDCLLSLSRIEFEVSPHFGDHVRPSLSDQHCCSREYRNCFAVNEDYANMGKRRTDAVADNSYDDEFSFQRVMFKLSSGLSAKCPAYNP